MTNPLLCSVSLFVLTFLPVVNQGISSRSSNARPSQARSDTGKKSKALEPAVDDARFATLLRVESFIDRVSKIADIEVRTKALVNLADLMWPENPAVGQSVFLKTVESLNRVDGSAAKDKTSSNVTESLLLSLKRLVISHLARHDKALAQRLIDEEIKTDAFKDNPSRSQQLYIDSANSMRDADMKAAIEFMEKSLQYGVSRRLLWFLNSIKQSNEDTANSLFSSALRIVAVNPIIDINDFLFLGSYIFKGPTTDVTQIGDAVFMAGVGGVAVANISGSPATTSPPELVRLYLDAAASVLGRSLTDQKQKALAYLAAFQLYRRALQSAPERMGAFAKIMTSLMPDLPPKLRDPSALAPFDRVNLGIQSVADEMQTIEQINEPEQKAAKILGVAHELFLKSDFPGARSVAEKNTDLKHKTALLRIIDFGETAKLIKDGQFAEAEQRTEKISASIERSVLWLALAHAWARSENKARALEAVGYALADARRLQELRRVSVMLAGVGLLGQMDPLIGSQVLAEVVSVFNQEVPAAKPSPMVQVLEAGHTRMQFGLTVEGIDYSFFAVSKLLDSYDRDEVISTIEKVRNEQALADGLLAVAAKMLKSSHEQKSVQKQ